MIDPPSHRTAPIVALVRWPDGASRREDLAHRGLPCVLVIEDGTPVPILRPGEDWVRGGADERDVAARLEHLAAVQPSVADRPPVGAPLLAAAGAAPDVAALDPREPSALVARALVLRAGRLVAIDELRVVVGDHELAAVVAAAEDLLAAEGWLVVSVGSAGYLTEPDGTT